MVITYRTDREALERMVPEPLEVVEPIVKYELIRMPHSTGFGSYSGSAAWEQPQLFSEDVRAGFRPLRKPS
jgi:acetoacetate decarboxylase